MKVKKIESTRNVENGRGADSLEKNCLNKKGKQEKVPESTVEQLTGRNQLVILHHLQPKFPVLFSQAVEREGIQTGGLTNECALGIESGAKLCDPLVEGDLFALSQMEVCGLAFGECCWGLGVARILALHH